MQEWSTLANVRLAMASRADILQSPCNTRRGFDAAVFFSWRKGVSFIHNVVPQAVRGHNRRSSDVRDFAVAIVTGLCFAGT